ncbi:MAG: hypothetical protein ACOVOR_04440 [Rhabdochlamydiaceae bacterium]
MLEEIPLLDELDHDILMHKKVHFGDHFETMIEEYSLEKRSAVLDVSLERIKELQRIEEALDVDLVEIILNDFEKEKMHCALESYRQLTSFYSDEKRNFLAPRLIADLILSEEDPSKEIEAICRHKEDCYPLLMALIKSPDFYDPLFPGYGLAPEEAVRCLGLMKEDKAIPALFEALGQSLFADEAIISALTHMQETAGPFLLRKMTSRPINHENEKAIMVLLNFSLTPALSSSIFEFLRNHQEGWSLSFVQYLIMGCEALPKNMWPIFKEFFLTLPYRAEWQEEANSLYRIWK